MAAPTGSMNWRRRQHNADGAGRRSVLATGGQSTIGGGGQVDLANAVYAAERWNPATGAWTELAPAAVARRVPLDGPSAAGWPRARPAAVASAPSASRSATCAATRRSSPRPTSTAATAAASSPRARRSAASPRAIAYAGGFAFTSPQAASIRKVGLLRLGRADPLRGPEPALRAARLLRRRDDADGGRAQQPQRGARGPLHAVRGRCRRRPVGERDRRARPHGRPGPVAGQPRAQPAGDEQHALRDHGGPGEGGQRLRLRWPLRQVLHEGGGPLAARSTSDRTGPSAPSSSSTPEPAASPRPTTCATIASRRARAGRGVRARAATVTGNTRERHHDDGGAALGALRAPDRDRRRAGEPSRSRPDLRARGLQRRRAAAGRGAADRLLGARRDRPGAALRGRRLRGRRGNSGSSARTRRARWRSRRVPGDARAATPACSAARRWKPAGARRCRRA